MDNQYLYRSRMQTRVYFGATDVGQRRDQNEDAFFPMPTSSPDPSVIIVADGMGGHQAGEIASRKTTTSLGKRLTKKSNLISQEDIKKWLIHHIKETHKEIVQLGEENIEFRGMGCTLAVAYIDKDWLHACHVGDARIYHIRDGKMEQLGVDHSVLAQSLKDGLINEYEAKNSTFINHLTMAIGGPYTVEPEYLFRKLQKGDLILLCSDGLWNMVSEEDILKTATTYNHAQEIVESLIEQANQAGGHDNITVTVFIH